MQSLSKFNFRLYIYCVSTCVFYCQRKYIFFVLSFWKVWYDNCRDNLKRPQMNQ